MKKDSKGFGNFAKTMFVMFTVSYTLISLIWQINMHIKLKNDDFVSAFTQNVNTNSAQKILNLFVNNTIPTILYYSIIISITFGALVYIIKDSKEISDKYKKTEVVEEEKVIPKTTKKTSSTKSSAAPKTTKKTSSSKSSAAPKTTKKTSSSKSSATPRTTKKSSTKTSTAKKSTSSKK